MKYQKQKYKSEWEKSGVLCTYWKVFEVWKLFSIAQHSWCPWWIHNLKFKSQLEAGNDEALLMTRQIINEANTLDEMRGYYSSDGFKHNSVLILNINQSRLGSGDLQNWIAWWIWFDSTWKLIVNPIFVQLHRNLVTNNSESAKLEEERGFLKMFEINQHVYWVFFLV